MKKTLTLSLAAIALCATGTAVAQTAATSTQAAPVRGADMTRDAAQQRATQMFARLDINDDGEISAADREARAAQRFDAIDANSDGSISREEFTAVREDRRARMEERRAARAASGAQDGERMARRDGRRGPGMRGEGRRGPGMRGARGLLRNADADSNGAISQEEFLTAALARFDAADADNDGTVTREERRNARPEGRHGRGRMRG